MHSRVEEASRNSSSAALADPLGRGLKKNFTCLTLARGKTEDLTAQKQLDAGKAPFGNVRDSQEDFMKQNRVEFSDSRMGSNGGFESS